MTSDVDALRMLNATENLARKLATTPGGLVTIRARMQAATAGVRGQNYDSGPRGERREEVLMPYATGDDKRPLAQVSTNVPVPSNDPTGESVLHPDEARADLARLDKLVNLLHKTAQDIGGLHDKWTPRAGAKPPTEDGPGDDWCASCWRSNKTCEPVSKHYKGLCRWCGDWRGTHKALPPMPILEAHLRNEVITTRLVSAIAKAARRRTA